MSPPGRPEGDDSSARREGRHARLRLAFYGDDFTGATDTLATVAQAGLRGVLFLGAPSAQARAAAGELDVLGIAGAARAMDRAAMHAELAPVAACFAGLDAPVLHYKCCSTFDSAPAVGSIGAAATQLAAGLANRFVPIVGGQPSLSRYCAFGHLFAAAGDGAVHRIDRHPTMSRHPVTPMHESDLRRHLGAQGLDDIALVDWRALESDDALPLVHDTMGADGLRPVLFDALNDGHLLRIGGAIWDAALRAQLLAIGPSSVAQALIAHWRTTGAVAPTRPGRGVAAAAGPVFVLAGSQSPVTAHQLACAAGHYETVPVDPARLVTDASYLDEVALDCATRLRHGRATLAHTGARRDGGPPAREVAVATGRLLHGVLARAPAVRRVGIAGGDTSSFAAAALDLWGLSFVGAFGPGACLVRAHAHEPQRDGLELLLKGGQMGPPGIFAALLGGT